MTDGPIDRRTYRLTGGADSIMGGATWAGAAVEPTKAEQAAPQHKAERVPALTAAGERAALASRLDDNTDDVLLVNEKPEPEKPEPEKPEPGPFDDLKPISTYSSDQAVDDGMLVEAAPEQFGRAVLFTRAVFEVVFERAGSDEEGRGRSYLQCAIPLIQDALMICKAHPKTSEGRPEDLWTKGLEGNVTGREVWIGRNERGGITLMFPEDY